MMNFMVYEDPVTRLRPEGLAKFHAWTGPVDADGYRRAAVRFQPFESGDPTVERLLDPNTVKVLGGAFRPTGSKETRP